MTIEIRHREHVYTYRHPVGWSGGDETEREKLNETRPAGEYPVEEAEEKAVRHALAGILAGGVVIAPESGRRVLQGSVEPEAQDVDADAPGARPDRILEETGELAGNPDRILEEAGEEDRSGDPDRILEG